MCERHIMLKKQQYRLQKDLSTDLFDNFSKEKTIVT